MSSRQETREVAEGADEFGAGGAIGGQSITEIVSSVSAVLNTGRWRTRCRSTWRRNRPRERRSPGCRIAFDTATRQVKGRHRIRVIHRSGQRRP
jgi:hypothetical protein